MEKPSKFLMKEQSASTSTLEEQTPPQEKKINFEDVMALVASSQAQLANSQAQFMNETKTSFQNQSINQDQKPKDMG